MNNSYKIQEIRILPMERKEEFKTEEAARRFLAVGLIQQDGRYYYRERGIDVKNDYALILFQYGVSIIGYGILRNVEEDMVKDRIDSKWIQYNGYLQFFTLSIHNVASITLSEIQQIDKRITHFSNPKWRIGKEHFDQVYSEIYDLLLQKQIKYARSFLV